MSRTFRRTQKGKKADWLPCCWTQYKAIIKQHPELTREQDRQIWNQLKQQADFFYSMNTPSHWTRQMMTRPKRAQNRMLCQRIEKGQIDPDNLSVDPWNKPYIYYW